MGCRYEYKRMLMKNIYNILEELNIRRVEILLRFLSSVCRPCPIQKIDKPHTEIARRPGCEKSVRSSRKLKPSPTTRRSLVKFTTKRCQLAKKRIIWSKQRKLHYNNPSVPADSSVSSTSTSDVSYLSTPQQQQQHSGHQNNPLPRHKRSSHIKAEHKRRSKIQNGFDTLKVLVPGLGENTSSKESKSSMLFKAADHCQSLKEEVRQQKEEEARLQQELLALNQEINQFQQQLPEDGVRVEKPACTGEAMFNNYFKSRTLQNWKFWIFGFVAKPLFSTYNTIVTTSTQAAFIQSVLDWADRYLSLVNLRPIILKGLRQISTETSIMTDPEQLPQEAFDKTMASSGPFTE